jgi:signal transduction histidine kinase
VVNADKRLMHLAIENLIGNAWKFTSKKPKASIELGSLEKNGEIIYFIRDDGVGFDMKFSEKIFEPFIRTHSDKEFSGTGIGLSIVERIIRRHGGRVWAEGEPDKGATIYFTLQ